MTMNPYYFIQISFFRNAFRFLVRFTTALVVINGFNLMLNVRLISFTWGKMLLKDISLFKRGFDKYHKRRSVWKWRKKMVQTSMNKHLHNAITYSDEYDLKLLNLTFQCVVPSYIVIYQSLTEVGGDVLDTSNIIDIIFVRKYCAV